MIKQSIIIIINFIIVYSKEKTRLYICPLGVEALVVRAARSRVGFSRVDYGELQRLSRLFSLITLVEGFPGVMVLRCSLCLGVRISYNIDVSEALRCTRRWPSSSTVIVITIIIYRTVWRSVDTDVRLRLRHLRKGCFFAFCFAANFVDCSSWCYFCCLELRGPPIIRSYSNRCLVLGSCSFKVISTVICHRKASNSSFCRTTTTTSGKRTKKKKQIPKRKKIIVLDSQSFRQRDSLLNRYCTLGVMKKKKKRRNLHNLLFTGTTILVIWCVIWGKG